MPRIIRIALVALILPQITYGQKAIPNTPQGFQQQYHPAFESYQRHDERELQSRLDSFAMPSHWFADTFGPEQGAQLATQYAAEFAEFKKRTATSFASIDDLKARLEVDPATPTDIHTRRWTPAESRNSTQHLPPLRAPLPETQKFEIDYVLAAPGQAARLTSWIDWFVYLDGAFRYFGHANRAFWNSIKSGC